MRRELIFPIRLEKKKCHLWITAPPNFGKTRFARIMIQKYAAVMYNTSNNNPGISDATKCLILDEITNKNKVPREHLNQLCDGMAYCNAKFGGYQFLAKPFVIVLSNQHPEEVFEGDSLIDTILVRFFVLDIEEVLVDGKKDPIMLQMDKSFILGRTQPSSSGEPIYITPKKLSFSNILEEEEKCEPNQYQLEKERDQREEAEIIMMPAEEFPSQDLRVKLRRSNTMKVPYGTQDDPIEIEDSHEEQILEKPKLQREQFVGSMFFPSSDSSKRLRPRKKN